MMHRADQLGGGAQCRQKVVVHFDVERGALPLHTFVSIEENGKQ